jgi:flavin-dependent dehydrogenase
MSETVRVKPELCAAQQLLRPTIRLPEAAGRVWDVVVAGAGPAGAVAAHALTRRGCSVLLLDKAVFPRDKVCGCCLNPRVLHVFRGAGLDDAVRRAGPVPLRSFQLAARGASARIAITGGVALSRRALDAALAAEAGRAGAAILHGALVDVSHRDGEAPRLVLRSGDGDYTISARAAILATGLGNGISPAGQAAETNGARHRTAASRSRFGVGAILDDTSTHYEPGVIHMACARGGYVGLVRVEDGRLDVAAALDPGFARARGGPGGAVASILAEAGYRSIDGLSAAHWRGTPALTRRAPVLARDGVFLIGDAAGYVEPFTGEGIAWAVESAVHVAPLAARAVSRWRPELAEAWTRTYRRIVVRRQVTIRVLAALLRRPLLAGALVRVLRRAPRLVRPWLAALNAPSPQPDYNFA